MTFKKNGEIIFLIFLCAEKMHLGFLYSVWLRGTSSLVPAFKIEATVSIPPSFPFVLLLQTVPKAHGGVSGPDPEFPWDSAHRQHYQGQPL